MRDGVTSLYKSVCAEPDPCNRPCLDPDDTTMCQPLVCRQPQWSQLNPKLICNPDTVANYSVQSVKYCYCNAALFRHVAESPFGWITLMFTAEDLCSSYMNEFVFTYAVPYLTVATAAVVNILLQVLIRCTTITRRRLGRPPWCRAPPATAC